MSAPARSGYDRAFRVVHDVAHVAHAAHRLQRTPAGRRIAAKRVDLVNSASELDGIAMMF